MRILIYSLLLVCNCPAFAADAYVTTDKHGRKQYSDTPPDSPYQQIHIDIQNDYEWQGPDTFSYTPPVKKRRKHIKQTKQYSLGDLKTRCHTARARYNNFRGTDKNLDWDTYRARLAKYKAKRDEWCSRLAQGR